MREDPVEQCHELTAFLFVEAAEKVALNEVRVILQLAEVVKSGTRDGHAVATGVCRVGLAQDCLVTFEAGQDGADVVAVQAETPADFSLAERPVLLEGGEDRKVRTGAERHVLGSEARAGCGDLSCLPGDQGPETRRWLYR